MNSICQKGKHYQTLKKQIQKYWRLQINKALGEKKTFNFKLQQT